jgi:hypothetical protein
MVISKDMSNGKTYIYVRCASHLCEQRGRTRADAVEAELRRALVAKAYQVIRFVTDAAPVTIDPRLDGLQQELTSLRALQRRNPRDSLALAISEIENEIASIKHVKNKPSEAKNELLELLIHPDCWNEIPVNQIGIVYAELVEKIWIKNKAVTKIKLRV